MKTILTCLSLFAIDGDTVECDGQRVRLLGDGIPNVRGIDTPETWKPDCQRELQWGLAAKDRTKELLRMPGLKVEDSGERDRYGRILGAIRLPDGRTVGGVLLSEGLAAEWRPGYRANWCD
jgi:endonuclease YncB( thermonuclease family)